MYGIFSYMCLMFMVHVGKYTYMPYMDPMGTWNKVWWNSNNFTNTQIVDHRWTLRIEVASFRRKKWSIDSIKVVFFKPS